MRYARQTFITLLMVAPVLAFAQDTNQPTNDAPNPYTRSRTTSSSPTGAPGGQPAPWTSTRTARPSGSASAAVATRAWIARPARCRICERPEVRQGRQARQELRRRTADLPARHLRRQGRQRLGDRRSGQRAGAGARRGAVRVVARKAAGRAAGPIGPRPGATMATRSTSSAPKARCC